MPMQACGTLTPLLLIDKVCNIFDGMRDFVVHCLLGLARGGKLPVNRVLRRMGGKTKVASY